MPATSPSPGGSRGGARRWWPVIVLVVIALVLAAVLVPRLTGDPDSPRPTASPTASPTQDPADQLLAEGYDPDPGPFSLPDPAEGEKAAQDPVSVRLRASKDATTWGENLGLSFEATDLASPVWGSQDSNIDEMLGAMDHPVLRFGGNSVDRRMWWTSSDEPAPDWAEATVTPADLERVARAARKAEATVILTVDLGHEDPQRAADMVAHAKDAFGDLLQGVSIGNEPNGFHDPQQKHLEARGSSWGPAAYTSQLEDYASAIREEAPGTPIVGPGAYDAPWWRAFADSGVRDKTAMTMHWYPLWDCQGPASSIANPTVDDLTSPKLRAQARKLVGMGKEAADAADLPLWMGETGPTSCPGTNQTSRTHAQALWTGDYALTAAESGAELMAFHSTLGACRGGAPMSPLCARGTKDDPAQILQGRTSFLALLQLGQIAEGRVLTPTVSGSGRVMAHGVMSEDGTLSIVLVDMRDPSSDEGPAPVRISAPSGVGKDAPDQWHPEQGSQLTGGSLEGHSSTLGAMAPVDEDLRSRTLSRGDPITLESEPGSTTVIRLAPGPQASTD
ncbi:hypothetical protein DEO23_05680 [Brachybacterium endophyticum]|uniref:Uncharacterized protein n=1 Tax=Brachybacterium endophyticum TaxID=2182385 RepID=A0A2U2RKR7_9MICO|nr:hypothetical protein [Brachybacterium endophyticum]PWH06460.1 hypothetical protein DEO23_05680 [Brachybacterium endophyticum]